MVKLFPVPPDIHCDGVLITHQPYIRMYVCTCMCDIQCVYTYTYIRMYVCTYVCIFVTRHVCLGLFCLNMLVRCYMYDSAALWVVSCACVSEQKSY